MGINTKLQKERWCKIQDHFDYEISDRGRIRKNGEILAGSKGRYKKIHLWTNGKSACFTIHRLVLIHFGPPQSDVHLFALHNDGNSQNNHISNLRWGTNSDNMLDRKEHGTNIDGEKNGRAILTEKQVKSIKYFHARGIARSLLAPMFGVGWSTINHIIKGDTWKHVEAQVG